MLTPAVRAANIGSILHSRRVSRKLYLNVTNRGPDGKTCNNILATGPPETAPAVIPQCSRMESTATSLSRMNAFA